MVAKNKFVCIHGHFYQPPRENAWLEVVEMQDSAKPFHDWNERINFECYAPNATARILDEAGFIKKIANNYSNISFNIGPTLLSWLEVFDKETYRRIQEADKIAQKKFNGHGTAIAQAYSHLITPLANRQDKITQIEWGLKDFEKRFERKSEGIWLAETAVDSETLDILVDYGVKYTILAPRQAKSFRKIGDKNWSDTGSIETRRPYWYTLPSGRKIALFFYNGDIAQDVAFKGLLNSGKAFAGRFMSCFDINDQAQLAHIATDGESYGHHHRFGEMALADCLSVFEDNGWATLTNYADYLERFPPEYEVVIHENSSWSCVHGIERWRSDCGCNSGRPGWHQRWRAPLREALNWLRDELIPIYEEEAGRLVKDVWATRNDYISVILDRSEKNIEAFIERNQKKFLRNEEQVHLLRLMEMQRNAQLMFTSCGWFFDEISGLETHQIMQYACRAIDYAIQVAGKDFHLEFERRLASAPSNVYENGAAGYKKHVLPSRVNLERTGMHYAAASLFEKFPQRLELFNYICTSENFERVIAGNYRLVVGQTVIKSRITVSEKLFSFAAIYLGQHNIIGNISTEMDDKTFNLMKIQIVEAFKSTNLGEVISVMQTFFGLEKYTLYDLFHDEKIKILHLISEKSLIEAENAFRNIYDDNYQLMSSMQNNGLALPEAYTTAVAYIVNHDLERYFTNEVLSIRELQRLVNELKKWNIPLSNEQSFNLAASERINLEINKINPSETPVEQITRLNNVLTILQQMEIKLNLWKSQNAFSSMVKSNKNGEWTFSNEAWQSAFTALGGLLKVKM
jgi:alpha-amylase/alpha-mannosidase (GH57 family)